MGGRPHTVFEGTGRRSRRAGCLRSAATHLSSRRDRRPVPSNTVCGLPPTKRRIVCLKNLQPKSGMTPDGAGDHIDMPSIVLLFV